MDPIVSFVMDIIACAAGVLIAVWIFDEYQKFKRWRRK
jgi:hypothetical protein